MKVIILLITCISGIFSKGGLLVSFNMQAEYHPVWLPRFLFKSATSSCTSNACLGCRRHSGLCSRAFNDGRSREAFRASTMCLDNTRKHSLRWASQCDPWVPDASILPNRMPLARTKNTSFSASLTFFGLLTWTSWHHRHQLHLGSTNFGSWCSSSTVHVSCDDTPDLVPISPKRHQQPISAFLRPTHQPSTYCGWLRNPAPLWMLKPLEIMGSLPPINWWFGSFLK